MSTSEPMDYEFDGGVLVSGPYHRNLERGRRGCPALSGTPHLSWNQSNSEWHPEHSHRPLDFPTFHPPLGHTSSPPHWSAPPDPLRSTGTSGARASNSVHAHDAPLPSPSSYMNANHTFPVVQIPARIPVPAPATGAAPALSQAPAHPPQPPAVSRVSPPPPESRHNHATTAPGGEGRPLIPATPGYPFRPVGRPYNLPRLESGPRDRHTTSSSPPNPTSVENRSRPSFIGRPRIGQVADRDSGSSSPGPSVVDDDGDFDIGPNLQFFGYLNSARQSQVLRGQMPNKRVASRRALASLQQVDLDSLPDTEKSKYFLEPPDLSLDRTLID